MRRKANKNNGGSNNGGGQMQRRRFRPEQNSGKIKSVAANRDKYLNLAREAMSQGDRIEAENYLQHADHYFRVLSALQEEDARHRPEPRQEQPAAQDDAAADETAEVTAEVQDAPAQDAEAAEKAA